MARTINENLTIHGKLNVLGGTTLPQNTAIGGISLAELGCLSGASGNIQQQFVGVQSVLDGLRDNIAEKHAEIEQLVRESGLKSVGEKYSTLFDYHLKTSEAIMSLSEIVDKLVNQVALIEDKYNIIDTIREDK